MTRSKSAVADWSASLNTNDAVEIRHCELAPLSTPRCIKSSPKERSSAAINPGQLPLPYFSTDGFENLQYPRSLIRKNASPPSPASSEYSDSPPELIRSSGFLLKESDQRQHENSKRLENKASSRCQYIYECTFCNEAFKTKHNWKRHEAAIHLPQQRWICARQGPYDTDVRQNVICAFCGKSNPDRTHVEKHNYAECQGRTVEERTFHRKEYLERHLRQAHNVKSHDMARQLHKWKVAPPKVRSICGFCGIAMQTFSERADHLADHFRMGKTMCDWKGEPGLGGDGFSKANSLIASDDLNDVDNIFSEKDDCLTTYTRGPDIELPQTAYELIATELMHYAQIHIEAYDKLPTSNQLRFEACRIIFASEVESGSGTPSQSWLRELILGSSIITQKAACSPLRLTWENKLPTLQLPGRDTLFETCPLELQLHNFVRNNEQGHCLPHIVLQKEAAKLLWQTERRLGSSFHLFASWLVELTQSSTEWLVNFQGRYEQQKNSALPLSKSSLLF